MRSVEQQYVKKTPIEHVLLRPDTYIGSVEKDTAQLFVYENGRLVSKAIEYIPGLYKIFDEILVNAADNKQRDHCMSFIKVWIDKSSCRICVENDGSGIPVVLHKKENVYVPELIFGQLLTSSNYDDNEKKVTGGRNGYGAKLCNIFSKQFVVETRSGNLYYKQVFERNMSVTGNPKVIDLSKIPKNSFEEILRNKYFGDVSEVEEVVESAKRRKKTNNSDTNNDKGRCLEQMNNGNTFDRLVVEGDRGLENLDYARLTTGAGTESPRNGVSSEGFSETSRSHDNPHSPGLDPVESALFNPRFLSIPQRYKLVRKNEQDFTRITFKPDLSRFGVTELSEDFVRLLAKRVHDLCGTVRNVRVYLNGVQVQVNGFSGYCSLYAHATSLHHAVINDRWEIAVCASTEGFKQVSFVNSIATLKGGTHVTHVLEGLAEPLAAAAKKTEKSLAVTPAHVKTALSVFVNALIENPAFDSQTKECLTTQVRRFGSACAPLGGLIKTLVKDEVLISGVAAQAQAKARAVLAKSDGSRRARLQGLPKLDDANLAGTAQGHRCTLILTEGDSAKALAVSGLGVVGRDTFGVFPLRGKLLNVRDAGAAQVAANAEICALKRILGLQHGREYSDTRSLRYGSVMLMTDQDADGSHIKGLLLNFFDALFPTLLSVPGFVQCFATPIVRCTAPGKEPIDFFTLPEFQAWSELPGSSVYRAKYYKGLGTSTSADARRYFADLPRHVRPYAPATPDDRALLALAFAKKHADRRKGWLAGLRPGTYLDSETQLVTIGDFVNKELILFSHADNVRSIPSAIDGLKPGQRKVVFAAFKRNLRQEIKVAQLAGYVAENSAYHHGEASLCGTIIGLAQSYVGANNVALLTPSGQFGTRLQGGKDAASPRYLFTALERITRLIFRIEDDPLLRYLTEDNESIEPDFYVPVVPMVLVNGAEGIGTGWSSSIPNHSMLDVIQNVRRKIRGEPMTHMTPFYKGFKGTIIGVQPQEPRSRRHVPTPLTNEQILSSNQQTGTQFASEDDAAIEGITMLNDSDNQIPTNSPRLNTGRRDVTSRALSRTVSTPNRRQNVPAILELNIAHPNDRNIDNNPTPTFIQGLEDITTPITELHVGGYSKFIVKGVYEFKDDCLEISELPVGTWTQTYKEFLETLVTSNVIKDYKEYHTENTVLFKILGHENINHSNIEKKLKLSSSITTSNLVCFDSYGKIKRYATDLDILEEFYSVRLDFYTKRKEHMLKVLFQELNRLKNKVRFVTEVVNQTLIVFRRKKAEIEGDLDARKYDRVDKTYDYLLNMAIMSLTLEKIKTLNEEMDQKKKQYNFIHSQTNKDLWLRDLDELEECYNKEYNTFLKILKEEEDKRNRNMSKLPKSSRTAKKSDSKTTGKKNKKETVGKNKLEPKKDTKGTEKASSNAKKSQDKSEGRKGKTKAPLKKVTKENQGSKRTKRRLATATTESDDSFIDASYDNSSSSSDSESSEVSKVSRKQRQKITRISDSDS